MDSLYPQYSNSKIVKPGKSHYLWSQLIRKERPTVTMHTNQPTERDKPDGLYGKFQARQESLSCLRITRRHQIGGKKTEAHHSHGASGMYDYGYLICIATPSQRRERKRSSIYYSIQSNQNILRRGYLLHTVLGRCLSLSPDDEQ